MIDSTKRQRASLAHLTPAVTRCIVLALALTVCVTALAADAPKPPNVVIILADDRDKPGASEHQKQHKMTGFHAYFEKGASDKLSGNRVDFSGINYTLLHERPSCPPPKACGTLI